MTSKEKRNHDDVERHFYSFFPNNPSTPNKQELKLDVETCTFQHDKTAIEKEYTKLENYKIYTVSFFSALRLPVNCP